MTSFPHWVLVSQMWNKKNKYGAKRTNGFSSGLEKKTHDMLQLLQRAGHISNLRCQHPVELTQAKIRTKIDFSANDKNGNLYFIEAKGVETERWIIIKKLWEYYGLGKLEVWKSNTKGIFLAETILPKM